jgi:hypothetical protein
MDSLEEEIAAWRSFVGRRPAVDGRDVDELETHLRDEIADLGAAGLAADEAFLVAVKRLGALDELSREFAREHSGRLWKQLVLTGGEGEQAAGSRWPEALLFAVGAAVTVQIARLVADFPDEEPAWLARNASLLVLPFVAGWFTLRRALPRRQVLLMAAAFVLVAIVVNIHPYDQHSATEDLAAAHLPIVLWFVVAHPYTGATLRSHERRMDFVRFTGEWCIYYVLIALGGGVLTGLTAGILEPAGIDPELLAEWVLPSGAAGAAIVAAWLVEAKQRVVENMAPVLTMVFTPLFAVMLSVAAVTYALTGLGAAFDRELLGLLDALMVVVVGLVLYGISAREPSSEAGWMDRIQLVAVASALVLDLMVLVSMAARVGDLGLSPNRAAALGLNLVLLVNLAGTARHASRFVLGRAGHHHLERWQTAYLPVFGAWAAVVVVVFPPAFGFA